ncbi:MATE family efflux transporter [Altererythrobacter aestuarii]|uniref:MATE family efflux transporter n=2 Tax=Alteraurantiacibacter aestuarii TaxID=650004 RepID=A0A844ZLP9_9SPHN|nr:MATE family efflux transporter [Alteraurantiacibacter aestuarii]
MLGQASIPLVGVVDATVIGRTGDAAALAGVALGATVIGLIFWSFGFLRMGMTGLTAQADGANDRQEVEALLLRALLIGFGIGLALLALQWPLGSLAFSLLAGGEDVTAEASQYVSARFFGAPAALCVFAINGWLLGLGRTRSALVLQIVMNIVNVIADLVLVWGYDMGAAGVGIGTALAEWTALAVGLVLAGRVAGGSFAAIIRRMPRSAIIDPAALKRLFAVNRDIMIRTLALLFMFTWYANAGARLGTVQLAANHVLLQFINMAAFVLDAFAFTAESRVGNAIGARSKATFLRAVRLAGEFSLAAALVLSAVFLIGGPAVIGFITTDPLVRAEAMRFMPFAALVPLIGMPSWLLDGIFIGATRGRALRNAGVLATLLYLALDLVMRPQENLGVWIAFSASYFFRAGALALYLPGLLRSLDCGDAAKMLDEGPHNNAQ